MTSQTDIANRALGRIGSERILDMDGESLEAQACKLHFAGTRDEVLRAHRWNFATSRAVLSRLAAAPLFGWRYQFGLPSDFLRALEVNGSEDGRGTPWAVENGNLMINVEAVNLVYVRREENTALWDSLFAEALTLKLASKLATTLRGSSSQVIDFQTEYERLTAPLARRVDANEGRERLPLLPLRSLSIGARYGGGYFGYGGRPEWSKNGNLAQP